MYTEFFGLSEVPFSIAPDPAYLFLSDRHREALAHLTFGFNDTGGFVLLTGEVGTGKTTVCRCLLEQLPENTRTAFILNPALDAQELLAAICDELHLPYEIHQDTIKVLFDRLRDHLLERHEAGENTVLIIDEAQHLRPEVLEQLRLLTNLETNKKKLLKVILIGQPELQELLRQRELRQLAQRITARYHLLPLTRDEVIQYVQHRLKVAGCQRPVFTRNALNKLHKLSGGVPRLINLLCDRSMLAAYAAQQWQVDGKLLKAASREVQGLVEDTSQSNSWLWQGISAVAASVVLVMLIWQFWPMAKPEPVIAEAQPESDWMAVAQQSRNLPEGFKELAAIWGVNEPRSDCQSLRRYGLQCLWSQQPINRLTVLDHPALLKLQDDQGMQFYAVLTGVQGESVQLHMAGQQLETDMDWLLNHYQGSSVLVWQPPQGYQGSIGSNASASQIQWLETQLSFLQGQPPRVLKRYDAQLAERIRWFQLSQNLEPDGIAGDQTLIQLNAQMGDVPLQLSQEL
ncbi:general secretion pathway protein GspA [Neiella marina]|uniref:General secretion pathway protein GspA n=1 Tax=Neiella marina TaxID=508461 RepID=A0A8J2U675_9GAMM|nr:ExeA family protein [Neiella marina]GGA81795.1 general secretion pathway protein GspA [Neiella marina]